MRTYSAFYQEDHARIIFRHLPARLVRTKLPPQARVHPDSRSTIGRDDGGDELEFAFFEVDGEVIVVQCDGVPPQRRQGGSR